MSNTDMAAAMLAAYGSYPIASTFDMTDSSPGLHESEVPAYSAAFDVDTSAKRHAACDECRKRKLKCSGDPTGCERCVKQKLTCHYSAQKQMGRPRKRQKTGDTRNNDEDPLVRLPESTSTQPQHPVHEPPPSVPEPVVDPDLTDKDIERTNFQNICSASMAQTVKRNAAEARAAAGRTVSWGNNNNGNVQPGSQSSSNTSPFDVPQTPAEGEDSANTTLYPTDVSQWPDFSDMTMLPVVVTDRNEREKPFLAGQSGTNRDPAPITGSTPYSNYLAGLDVDPSTMGQLPTVPACPCLPNLYLTLSTLSTLSAFPVSSGMIDTLLNAHRTCRSVIYCAVCPQKMQSGSQNVFLSTMLVTVLADHWHRVKRAGAQELRLGFGSPDPESIETIAPMGIREDLEWRTFGYHLIRAFVFGDHPIPDPPTSTTSSSRRKPQILPTHISSEDSDASAVYTLDSLVQALERRQKQWHDVEPYHTSREFPIRLGQDNLNPDALAHPHGLPRGYAPGMTLEDIKKCEDAHRASGGADEGLLCLKIVKHSRIMMNSLEGDVPRVEG
ncbi:hypothetical protein CLCR_09975 [Cladophialophora carrionii]|uniref:Zn(2)-C6 fungal-type domain-containing protein n=1 Tax=Cladophialophora carrionii TaxID=86049 RepID=A0A1C1D048_9EURO|nr:hypothetical protein CLCR_09975 [Cladophialophora carrionii]